MADLSSAKRKLHNRTLFDRDVGGTRLVIRMGEDDAGLEYLVGVGCGTATEPDEKRRLVDVTREEFSLLLHAEGVASANVIPDMIDNELGDGTCNIVGNLHLISRQLDPTDKCSLAGHLIAVLAELVERA